MQVLIDITGWLGSFLILSSYTLTLIKTRNFSTVCKFMNLFGGLMIAINCFYYEAIPSLVTNLIWSFIAIFSLYSARKHFQNTCKS